MAMLSMRPCASLKCPHVSVTVLIAFLFFLYRHLLTGNCGHHSLHLSNQTTTNCHCHCHFHSLSSFIFFSCSHFITGAGCPSHVSVCQEGKLQVCVGARKRCAREAVNACNLAPGFQFMSFTCGLKNIFLFLGSNGNPSLIAAGFS